MFDATIWNEVKPNVPQFFEQGRVCLRATCVGHFIVEQQGVEVVGAVGWSFDEKTTEGARVLFVPAHGEKHRVFILAPVSHTTKPRGERMTNVDRIPMESASVAAVTSALRELNLQRRAFRQETAAAEARLKAISGRSMTDPDPKPKHLKVEKPVSLAEPEVEKPVE